jgi:hypothetical protein
MPFFFQLFNYNRYFLVYYYFCLLFIHFRERYHAIFWFFRLYNFFRIIIFNAIIVHVWTLGKSFSVHLMAWFLKWNSTVAPNKHGAQVSPIWRAWNDNICLLFIYFRERYHAILGLFIVFVFFIFISYVFKHSNILWQILNQIYSSDSQFLGFYEFFL